MLTLFLDFDGVLHPEFCHESRHFDCLPAFEHAARQIPDCSIVITSTWRQSRSFERLRQYFAPDVAERVVGVTPAFSTLQAVPDRLLGYEREAECDAWLRSRQRSHLPWLAVDDRSWLFRPFNRHVLLVNGATGLTPGLSEELVQRARLLYS